MFTQYVPACIHATVLFVSWYDCKVPVFSYPILSFFPFLPVFLGVRSRATVGVTV